MRKTYVAKPMQLCILASYVASLVSSSQRIASAIGSLKKELGIAIAIQYQPRQLLHLNWLIKASTKQLRTSVRSYTQLLESTASEVLASANKNRHIAISQITFYVTYDAWLFSPYIIYVHVYTQLAQLLLQNNQLNPACVT